MKKNIWILAIVFFVGSPFFTVSAQTLTRDDVKAVAPQLVSSLNTLSVVVGQKQNQFNRQNIALYGIAGTMGSIVNTASELDRQNLSSVDRVALDSSVNLLASSVGVLSSYVGNISKERMAFNQVLDGVVNVLGSIAGTISEAITST